MKTLLTLFLFCFTLILTAQEWERQHPNTILNQMQDVEVNVAGFGLATGSGNVLLATQNFGETWEALDEGQSNATDIVMIPGTTQEALVWNFNRFLKTIDSGASWSEIIPTVAISGTSAFISVPDADHIFVANQNMVVKSTDGGMNWEAITPMDDLTWHSMHFVNATKGWLGTTTGQTYSTTDGGANWTEINNQFTDPVMLSFMDESIGFAGVKKQLCKTTDGGENWTVINATGFGSNIKELRPVTEDWIVAAQGNRVYSTTNGGATITIVFPVPYSYTHNGICPLPDGRVWSAGSYGTIGFSEDQGFTYEDQLLAVKNYLRFIDFADTQNGWAGGYNYTLLKTTDGGENWIDFTANNNLLESIHDGEVVSADEVWVCGGGGVLRTTDGGENWESIYNSNGNRHYDMAMDGNRIFLSGYDKKIHRSLDAGLSWEVIDTPSEEVLSEVFIVDASVIYGAGWHGAMIKSIDGGDSWDTLPSPTDKSFGGLFFHDALDGWAIVDNFHPEMYHTIDGGMTWEAVALPGSSPLADIYFEDDQHGFAVGGSSTSGRVFETTDGGMSWEEIYVGSQTLRSFAQATEGELTRYWAAGLAGTIISLDVLSTGTRDPLSITPLNVYPNPTNGQLLLEIPKTLSSEATLTLFTTEGQIVWTRRAINQIDMSSLPAGIYYLQLTDDAQSYQARVNKY